MRASWKTVRFFICSTLRDMHAERDYLVKVVFPKLREKLEGYRIHLDDIDLRWGVTEEQVNNDQALDLCLEQIDRCRPFFVGILGERYGWVPKTFSDQARSKYGWVQYQTGKSITELEILHGVLGKPDTHSRALFYFRNPSSVSDVPQEIRSEVQAEDAESAEKLAQLKQTIREANLPVPPFENYPCQYHGLRVNWRLLRAELSSVEQQTLQEVAGDGIVDRDEYERLEPRLRGVVLRHGKVYLDGLQDFGQRVYDQLWEAIQAEYELPDEPPTMALAQTDPLAEEADYHERFMESRLRVYVGRNSLYEQLARFADGNDEVPCLVTGPSGSGKSAALAKFVTTYRTAHPDVLLIPHFIGASPASTSLRQVLLRFCRELFRFGGLEGQKHRRLAEITGDDEEAKKKREAVEKQYEIPQEAATLASRFREFVDKIPNSCRLILVIDALNQLDEADNSQTLYWLPWQLPQHVKIITSCISDLEKEAPARKVFEHREHHHIEIEPLTDTERREIIREIPSLSAKTLDERQVKLILSNPATKNPLFLLVALEELRGFGSFEQLNRRIEEFPREGDTLTTVFLQVIESLEAEFNREVVQSVLSLLASARRGLSDRELLELLEGVGQRIEEGTGDLFPVLRQLRPYLIFRAELLDFYHQNLGRAVRERYLATDEWRAAGHDRLAKYFAGQDYFVESLEEQRARVRRLPPTPRPVNIRKVDELPWQRLEVAKLLGKDDPNSPHWDAVADLLTDWQFLEAKAEAQP